MMVSLKHWLTRRNSLVQQLYHFSGGPAALSCGSSSQGSRTHFSRINGGWSISTDKTFCFSLFIRLNAVMISAPVIVPSFGRTVFGRHGRAIFSLRKRGELVAVPAMGDAYFARRLAGFLLAQLSFKTGGDEKPSR
ncbi:MAG: hypothetical protein P8Y40_00620 [Desulfobacterales bacterium]